jgi:signal transduction histidine kinase
VEQPVLARPSRDRGLLYDALIALGATALALSIFFSITPSIQSQPLQLAAVLTVIHNLCLVFRRVRSVPVIATQLLTGILVAGLHLPVEILGLGILVGTYSLASQKELRLSLPALGIIELAVFVAQQISQQHPDVTTQIGNALVIATSWFLGNSVHARRAYARALERRNEELKRARDELARTAVSEERLRIARELHDVVAHSLSLIAVQSGVGAYVIDSRPEEAKRSLQLIEDASKSALTEIRRVLGMLRKEQGDTALNPAPRLADLRIMVERISATGPPVELQLSEDASRLPAGIQLTAFRIVQEALTNVVKHSNGTKARVVITRITHELRVEVIDDGIARRGGLSSGQGLIGMRERVEMFGGRFQAGPLPEGGWRVDARLPVVEEE